jgi:hypothetical protein
MYIVDDGPYNYEDDIAATMKQDGIVGTYFFNGNNWVRSFSWWFPQSFFYSSSQACIYDRAAEIRAAYANGTNLIG